MSNLSKKQLFETLPPEKQLKLIKSMSAEQIYALKYDWDWNGRPNQQFPKGDWYIWALICGRGYGKTRTGSEIVLEMSKTNQFMILIGRSDTDLKDILIKGESGILNCASKHNRPVYKNEQLHFPNGSIAYCVSAQEPDGLRGYQSSFILMDEFAAYPYPEEIYNQATMGHRLKPTDGSNPKLVIATTPKPIDFIIELVKKSKQPNSNIIITNGNTRENMSNLAPSFIRNVVEPLEGTRIGRQEINGEILDENPNALFSSNNIEKYRVPKYDSGKNLIDYKFSRIVVGIDPAVSSNATSDSTGIVVGAKGLDGHYYIIEDATMLAKPIEWSTKAVNLYHLYNADRIVAEVNNGGDLIEQAIRSVDDNVSYKQVRAMKNKILRAEPIANFYERGIVHHIGIFKELEDQMTQYTGLSKKSPDRLDALVWVLTELTQNKAGGFLDFVRDENEKVVKEIILPKRRGW